MEDLPVKQLTFDDDTTTSFPQMSADRHQRILTDMAMKEGQLLSLQIQNAGPDTSLVATSDEEHDLLKARFDDLKARFIQLLTRQEFIDQLLKDGEFAAVDPAMLEEAAAACKQQKADLKRIKKQTEGIRKTLESSIEEIAEIHSTFAGMRDNYAAKVQVLRDLIFANANGASSNTTSVLGSSKGGNVQSWGSSSSAASKHLAGSGKTPSKSSAIATREQADRFKRRQLADVTEMEGKLGELNGEVARMEDYVSKMKRRLESAKEVNEQSEAALFKARLAAAEDEQRARFVQAHCDWYETHIPLMSRLVGCRIAGIREDGSVALLIDVPDCGEEQTQTETVQLAVRLQDGLSRSIRLLEAAVESSSLGAFSIRDIVHQAQVSSDDEQLAHLVREVRVRLRNAILRKPIIEQLTLRYALEGTVFDEALEITFWSGLKCRLRIDVDFPFDEEARCIVSSIRHRDGSWEEVEDSKSLQALNGAASGRDLLALVLEVQRQFPH